MKTSVITPGWSASSEIPLVEMPQVSRESVSDADSRIMPARRTPFFYMTSITALPLVDLKVGIPIPRTTMLSLLRTSGLSKL